MKLTSSLKLVKPTPHPFAVACLATVLTAACMSLVWTLTDDSPNRIDAYGSNLAQSLAQLSLDPLLKQDRIALGVLANRTLALPEVAGVSVVTIDDRVLAASGRTDNSVRFTEPITFDDSIMGYVRIALRADARPFPMASVLMSLLSALLVPLVTVGAFSIHYQAAAATPADAEDVVVPVATVDHHLVAVNLYNQISMTPDARRIELDHAFEVAERVAGPYLGEVLELPGTGLLVHFQTAAEGDRALQIVCATFVLAELLAQYETDDVSSYRLGLHTAALPVGAELTAEATEIVDVARLSALAKYMTVAVSGAFPLGELRSDTVHSHSLEHPLLDELESVENARLITGLSSAQQTLVSAQVERLSNHWGSSASESTF